MVNDISIKLVSKPMVLLIDYLEDLHRVRSQLEEVNKACLEKYHHEIDLFARNFLPIKSPIRKVTVGDCFSSKGGTRNRFIARARLPDSNVSVYIVSTSLINCSTHFDV